MDPLPIDQIRRFVAERGWEEFHNPKNLAMALSAEVGELTALLQWLTPEQSSAVMSDDRTGQRVREEVADVAIYLLLLVDALDVDLGTVITDKVALNAERYPPSKSRGNATKYRDLS